MRVPLRKMKVGDLGLCSGSVLDDVEIAYLACGTLNAEGDNAVLVTHGFTSGPSMLLKTDTGVGEGSWADLVGPGAAIDTDRYFVVCPNMLGSCYGSTGPGAINPRTGRPFGPGFPEFNVGDIVASQHALLRRLGVTKLKAVVGPSYGGILALQWALDHPDIVEAIGVVVSGSRFPSEITPEGILRSLEGSPNWNGGWIYANGGVVQTLKALRIETLRAYGTVAVLRDQGLSPQACEGEIAGMAEAWAREFDPNSLVALCKAGRSFDVTAAVPSITARMLWVASSSDSIFPPDRQIRRLVESGRCSAQARYVLLESRYGHVASGADWRKWQHLLGELLQ